MTDAKITLCFDTYIRQRISIREEVMQIAISDMLVSVDKDRWDEFLAVAVKFADKKLFYDEDEYNG